MPSDFHLPERGARLLVLAPHPDDESLAAAGVIHSARQRGAEVTVAFMTSGDGFALGAAAQFRAWPTPSRLREFAVVRQAEAVRATSHLGLASGNLRFLGYPDRGLATLWLTHWDRPYTSKYTRLSASSDPIGEQPYTGRHFLLHLENLIAEEAPDLILYPDPADDHPDHWAAACFTRMALERLVLGGLAPTTWTYLTHRGNWPEPLHERPQEPLQPPAALTPLPVEWVQVPMSDRALVAKRAAIAEHRSQTRLVARFFRGFIRSGELFSRWPEPLLQQKDSPLRLEDPTCDRWGRSLCGGADVEALELEWRGDTIAVRVCLRKPAPPGLTYLLHWAAVNCGSDPSGTRTLPLKGELLAAIPLSPSDRLLMLGAEVWCGPMLLDRTPWRTIRLKGR